MAVAYRSLGGAAARPLRSGFDFMRRWPVIPLVILVALVIAGVFAPLLAPLDFRDQDLALREAPPFFLEGGTADRILGADHVGRDLLSRLIFGARISLVVMTVSLVSGAVFGVAVGIFAGYYGGLLDEIVMRLVDVWFAIPFLLFALLVVIIFEPSLNVVIAMLALLSWSGFVRNVRVEVMVLKTTDYVANARIAGASTLWLVRKHFVPGVLNTVMVIASLRVGGLMLAEASLSFLGAGIPSPTPAWGVMIAEGRSYLDTSWWIATWPGTALLLVVMSMNFLGDWLRDRLDPRLRQV